ncbi:MAG: hypothetical protein FWF79_03230 [Defluviitaleaceae bacterium]|nr:hypothetical protein [Defluviitaleaceae bacterium]
MKFEANRQSMLEAAKCVARVAPSTSTTEILRGILVEGDEDTGEIHLTATNHEASIRQKFIASVEEGGEMLVNSRMLVDMLTKLDSEFVTFSADKPEVVTVRGGRCRFQISCISPQGYPKPIMPFPEESAIMTAICSLAKRTTFAVSDDENKPVLQCVQIKLKNNAVHAAASDGARMMLLKDAGEPTDEKEFLLPGRSLQMLASISEDSDVFEVSDIGNVVVFVRGDMIFTIRKLRTGSYMDTDAMVKTLKPIYSAVVDVGKMKEALSLVSVAALAGGSREPINMALSNGEIRLQCYSSYSEANSSVPANVSKETPDTGFFYDILSLTKLFQILSGKVKLMIDERGCLLAKTRTEAYFQAPLRGSTVKVAKQEKEKNRAKGANIVKENKAA